MLSFAVIGTTEWLLIAFVVVLLFGARKLPELARSLGSSVNEFKRGMADGVDKDKKSPTPDGPSSASSSVNGSSKDH